MVQILWENYLRKMPNFPGGPVVKILHFHCRGHGFNPWSGKFHMPRDVAKN